MMELKIVVAAILFMASSGCALTSESTEITPSTTNAETSSKVVCYYTNWSVYRTGDGEFTPELVDPALCTHLIYAFMVLDESTLLIKHHDEWADITVGGKRLFERVFALKKTNPGLKIIVAIGGWTDSAFPKYSQLVNSPASRAKFISHALAFIKQHGFDGLDLDWEYPVCWQGNCELGPASDKQGFTAWVQELRAAFDKSQPRLLLTAAVSASKRIVDHGYDVAEISKHLDFINVMTYDYFGSWDKQTGHNAPLYHYPGVEQHDFNANFSIHYWLQLGAPKEKLIMGLPFYGQTWTLADRTQNGIGAPAVGAGDAGPFTQQPGMLSYYEICTKINQGGWTVVSDSLGRIGPYAFKDDQWISFDDVLTIKRKSEFVRDNRLGGAMIWSLDFDDFRNICCLERFPLLRTVNRVLRAYPAAETSANSTSTEGFSCNYQVKPPVNEPVDPHAKKICITSRCAI